MNCYICIKILYNFALCMKLSIQYHRPQSTLHTASSHVPQTLLQSCVLVLQEA